MQQVPRSITREQIFGLNGHAKPDDLKAVRVEVPEWGPGAFVFVRTMTSGERDAFEIDVEQRKQDGAKQGDPMLFLRDMRARTVVLCACDEEGERIFEPSDAPELTKRSAAVVSRLFDVACKLNGITKADADELQGK